MGRLKLENNEQKNIDGMMSHAEEEIIPFQLIRKKIRILVYIDTLGKMQLITVSTKTLLKTCCKYRKCLRNS